MKQPADIFIIDDNPSLQLGLRSIIGRPCACFSDVISAIAAIDEQAPQLIFLDLLPNGPDAFTFLNELASYSDLSQIPVVLMGDATLAQRDFSDYGVVGILDKNSMRPADLRRYVKEYCHA